MAITVTNAGPAADTLHLLPTAWFRNTWSWDAGRAQAGHSRRPARTSVRIEHPFLGTLELLAGTRPDGTPPNCCSARTRPTQPPVRRAPDTPYPKDGIGDHVIHGAATVNPDRPARSAPPGTG